MPDRLRLLRHWLSQVCGDAVAGVEPASADASFRRYFRVALTDGCTYVAMDAPPDREDCRPFVGIARRLADAGVHVPAIVASDLDAGFLLLEDLGDASYLSVLDEHTADDMYRDAISALVRFQQRADTAGLPAYGAGLLEVEMGLFPQWLLARHLGIEPDAGTRAMLEATFARLRDSALAQPTVFVHRDYHSRNLMVVGTDNPGVIDFQDAVAGPVTYDLVSLLRDCYVQWSDDRVDAWVERYLDDARNVGLLAGLDRASFRRWFDLMGVQRHLKAAGIFARLHHRDGKSGYLGDLPRTLGYIATVGRRYDELRDLAGFVASTVIPRLTR